MAASGILDGGEAGEAVADDGASGTEALLCEGRNGGVAETDNAVMPVTTYSAFVSVIDNGDGTSTVRLKGGFYRAYPNNDPPAELSDEAAVNAVTAFYDAGVAGLAEKYGK
mgnify:CR=1 FL=1